MHESYEALIADPDLDAVYNPLPNGLHGRWTRAALAAGKHVLCEKPFTANASEAREIAELAANSDRVVMEAFHYRYHPLTLRVEEIIASGELGTLKRVEAALCFPLPKFSDIRYNYSLAGGATMDAGCYAVHMVRTFGGSTPEVVSAQAKLRDPADRPSHDGRAAVCRAGTPGGSAARCGRRVCCRSALKVVGEHGELRVLQSGDAASFAISSRSDHPTANAWSVSRTAPPTRISSTLSPPRCCAAKPVKTTPQDAIENMTVIDAIYRAAGLPLREPS